MVALRDNLKIDAEFRFRISGSAPGSKHRFVMITSLEMCCVILVIQVSGLLRRLKTNKQTNKQNKQASKQAQIVNCLIRQILIIIDTTIMTKVLEPVASRYSHARISL